MSKLTGEEMSDFMPDLFEFEEEDSQTDVIDDTDNGSEKNEEQENTLGNNDGSEFNHLEAHTRWFAEKNGIDIPDDAEITEEYYEELTSEFYKGKQVSPLDSIPTQLQDVFEIALNENLSKEELIELIQVKDKIADTVSDEKSAETYLKEYYKELGDEDDEIEEKIAALKDKDRLVDRAKRLQSKDKNTSEKYINKRLENSRIQLEQQEQQTIKFLEDFGKEVDNYGFKSSISKQVKESLSDTGRLIEKALDNPKSLAQLATLMQFAYDEKNGEFKFEEFISKINPKNTKNRKVKNTLKTHLKRMTKSTPSSTTESFDLEDFEDFDLS